MNRVRAEALALVNWKGVFYERYELDPHVTALEGDNGAGKTTVMIAAYVVLLPDMTRLRFTNLGETGATGGDKGIWGRLGEAGRPAYAAIDFRLPRGERVVAGVHLERKGEPTVEPTPFVATGLADDVLLQETFLLVRGEEELVPELGELRENVARLGGKLTTFGSVRDYFADLFERGITPMRLGTDEERNKLNEMLRTSMTGGMSRGLLQGLRSFLLREENTLADTLTRMRSDLDACRRTRAEVTDAQRLEQEIGDVYEAGESMFATAIEGTRRRSDEMATRVAQFEQQRHEAEEALTRAEAAHDDAQKHLSNALEQKERAEQTSHAADAWAARVAEALRWARERAQRADAFATADAEVGRTSAVEQQAEQALRLANANAERARTAREAAAAGLANLQVGIDLLHRRAADHRRTVTALTDARRLLPDPTLDPDDALEAARRARAERDNVDNERRELNLRRDDAVAHREAHTTALAALTLIVEEAVPADTAFERARQALRDVATWRESADRRPSIAKELRAAEAEVKRQDETRRQAADLGVVFEPGSGAAAVDQALDDVEALIQDAATRVAGLDAHATAASKDLESATVRIRELERRAVTWRALAGRAATLSRAAGSDVVDRPTLDDARASLQARAHTAVSRAEALVAERQAGLDAARRLRQSGALPKELLEARDALGADLLAARFEDVDVDDAGAIEARLGPLVEALVVADVDDAVARLETRPAALSTVWLIDEGADLTATLLDVDRAVGADIVVASGDGVRVTRVPEVPTLGQAARTRRADALEGAARALGPEIDAARREEAGVRAALGEADALLSDVATWLAGDPTLEIDVERRRAADADRAAREARDAVRALRAQIDVADVRKKALRKLLPDATLLDAPDASDRVGALIRARADADRAAQDLVRIGTAPTDLERHQDALRRSPWSPEDVATAVSQIASLETRRSDLDDAAVALDHVAQNQEALRWTDAQARLDAEQGLVPSLKAQLEECVAAQGRAEGSASAAREARDTATRERQEADARRLTASERLADANRQLASTGVHDPDDALLAEARDRARTADGALRTADADVQKCSEDIGRVRSERDSARQLAFTAQEAEERERKQARPAIDAWEALRPQLADAGLQDAPLAERFLKLFGRKGSINLFPEAQSFRRTLLDRLARVRGAADILAETQRHSDDDELTRGERYLQMWLAVRRWLVSRLPAQIAEVDDPVAALQRLRDHLASLVERLDEHEQALRVDSADFATGIEVHLRRAQGKIKKLADHLVGLGFGSIAGIRVRMARVERMEQVLRALRTGEAQELMFQANLPVEEAMEQIFQRFGGGRTGGQRLLDYREYITLIVEVQRLGGREWEEANPTRLSTGEAIGVGAALMMVVLTQWEHDANLLRGRRAFGSMRLLFLDEANRLDAVNLATVFELCRKLDLQLVVAAPSVARAEGCTVFRLVRTKGDDGQPVVQVSGRRVRST